MQLFTELLEDAYAVLSNPTPKTKSFMSAKNWTATTPTLHKQSVRRAMAPQRIAQRQSSSCE